MVLTLVAGEITYLPEITTASLELMDEMGISIGHYKSSNLE
jgi:hypothetical protein